MSLIKLQGNASGTGALTIAAPNTDTDRTLTLPDTTGTIVMNEGSGIFKIDSSGNVLVGDTTARATTNSTGTTATTPSLQQTGTNEPSSAIGLFNYSTNTSSDPSVLFNKSLNATIGSHTAVTTSTQLGGIGFNGSDGTDFKSGAYIMGVAQANWTSTSTPGSLRFGTTAVNETTPTERMQISNSGAVIMPDVYADTVTGRDLYIASDGQLGYVSSTRASKTNIQDLSDVSWLYSLNPVSFQYRVRNEDDTYSDEAQPQPEYGLIAEDVELVNPDLVFYDETENGRELRGIQYSRLIAPLLKAIQEQQSLITDLTARVAQLEAN
jgi:hypothetical protein